MNWRRGMLRAWLLFAVVWVAAVTIVAVLDWRATPAERAYEVVSPSKTKYRVEGVFEATEQQIVSYVKTYDTAHPKPAECAAADPPNWCQSPIVIVMPGQSGSFKLWLYIWRGISAPSLVFLLGAGLAWVGSGFRKSSGAS
jgi:hypothetical protein